MVASDNLTRSFDHAIESTFYPTMTHRSHRRQLLVEQLEKRDLLSAVPYGASSQDTAEFMLGDVTVSVVLLESDGSRDPDTEDWTPELVAGVKANIEEGLQWWSDTLAIYSDVHALKFHVDYTYADNPVPTGYEPISRHSDDFVLWMEDFLGTVGQSSPAGFSTDIRNFNHQQRVDSGTNWAFTIFVVNADNDVDGKFDLSGSFPRAFAYSGGRFLVMPHHRPASVVAHEVGHMFWAFDEYSSGESYLSRRGYYGAQNTNGVRDNPSPGQREPSIMHSTGAPYRNHEISSSAREMLGWRDSDDDGIFDVLDVDHALAAAGSYDAIARTVRFTGTSSVQTLPNLNPEGTGNDMTINRITAAQYRVDGGKWMTIAQFDAYQVEIDVATPPLPESATLVEFRTIDSRIGVGSEIVSFEINPFQNPNNAFDVDGDTHVSPIDVLHIIRALNDRVSLGVPSGRAPYLDVSGDELLTPRDVLLVIQYINDATAANRAKSAAGPATDFAFSRSVGAAGLGSAEPEITSEWWQDDEDESSAFGI
jgi:hypothetical protein